MGQRSNRYCGSRLRTAFTLLFVGAVVLGAAVAGQAKTAAPAQFRLDHYQCYRVDPTSRFSPRRVGLVDQFGRSRAVVTQLFNLCPPVAKNRVRIRNRLAHLACYTLRPARFRSRTVVISNQFERAGRLVVVRPSELCLPSGKQLDPGPTPRPVRGLDHYQCYLVKPATHARVRPPFLVDQFGRSRPTIAGRARLCAPVRKNASKLVNPRDHLVCYLLRSTQRFDPRRALIANQFGQAKLVVARPDWLCVPSLKRLATRPDLTVAIANAPTQVSCPVGTRCITTVNFTVTNAGSVAVTTPFQVLVEADPGQSRTVAVAGLGTGASQSFTEQLGPAGNCYDPDCTVRVTVDSGNTVPESNEANNSASRTDGG